VLAPNIEQRVDAGPALTRATWSGHCCAAMAIARQFRELSHASKCLLDPTSIECISS
jgi:hypothetical protein